MGRLSKKDLLEKIVTGISDSGWNVLYLGTMEHPFQLQIYDDRESHRVLIYIWNITHGGGAARPADEYRIQVTGLDTDHFEQYVGVKTLVLGYWEEGDVFSGFDVRRHAGVLGSSPSLQIREQFLEQAASTGFAPCDKGNGEIAIAFRPDFFGEYVRNLEALHDFGESPTDFEALEAVSKQPDAINAEDLPVTNSTRKTTVTKISRKLRDAKFRRSVLSAYGYRCAFCGLQLDLIDAAHIVPASHDKSVELTCNGLALCALHHRAFDQCLVTLWEDYRIQCNEAELARLIMERCHGGLEDFTQGLHEGITVPKSLGDRPHVEYIRLGNRIRGWSEVAS